MQKVFSLLDQICHEPNGYKTYQEFLIKNNYCSESNWDMWCFVVYFSRKRTLANIAPEFLVILGEIFYTASQNPGVLSVSRRIDSGEHIDFDLANLIKQLREQASQGAARIEAIYALYSFHLNKPKNSTFPDFTDDEVKGFTTSLQAAIDRQGLTLRQNAMAHFLHGALPHCMNKGNSHNLALAQPKTFTAIKQAATEGDSWSQFMFGQALKFPPIAKAYHEASPPEAWFKKAADQGHFRALLAYPMLWGQQKEVTITYIKRAAEQGHPLACFFLSKWLGPEAGLDYLYKAAFQGILSARIALGDYFLNKKEMKEAIRWYQHAADFDDLEAYYKLGHLHELPGAEYDPVKAFSFYSIACNLTKNQREPDYPSLLHHDQRPPSGTIAKAAYALGRCYQSGVGTDPNLFNALNLFKFAMRLGSTDAQQQLQSIARQAREQQEAALTALLAQAASTPAIQNPEGSKECVSGEKRELEEANEAPSSRRAKTETDEVIIDDKISAPPVVIANALDALVATVAHAPRALGDKVIIKKELEDEKENSGYRPGF